MTARGWCAAAAALLVLQSCGEPAAPLPDDPPQPAALAFVSGSAVAISLQPVTWTVGFVDSAGAIVRTVTDTVRLQLLDHSPGVTLGGVLAVAARSGIATFTDLTVDKAGSYRLRATAAGLAPLASAPFTVEPGPPAWLELQGPPEIVAAGAALPPIRVVAHDRSGNLVIASSDTISLTLESHANAATLSGPVRRTLTDSGATFSGLVIDRPGIGYRLIAVIAGLGAATSAPFSATAADGSIPSGSPVDAGYYATCGVAAGGAAWCWGTNYEGQLGDGRTLRTDTALPVALDLEIQQLSVGRFDDGSADISSYGPGRFACALVTGGAIYCWGEGYEGVPQLASGSLVFRQVTTGMYGICGLSDAGDAYCWRHGDSPARVQGTPALVTLSQGSDYACGLASDGTPYCFYFFQGAPGDPSPLPQRVPGTPGLIELAIGWGSTVCGRAEGGDVWCWRMEYDSIAAAPVRVNGSLAIASLASASCGLTAAGRAYCWQSPAGAFQAPTPLEAATGYEFRALEVGPYRSCGITTGGDTYCWPRQGAPTRIRGPAFAAVGAGSPAACGLTSQGRAWCWGTNVEGMLGDGHLVRASSPIAVAGGTTFRTVSMGGQAACGITLDGGALCWGSGSGNASSRYSGVPQAVAGGHRFRSIGVGNTTACALTQGGAAWCWGAGDSIPQLVGGGHTFVALSTGDRPECALTAAAEAWCWTGSDRTPVRVGPGARPVALSSHSDHACALTARGEAWCWGNNSVGALGSGRTGGTDDGPVLVTGGHTFAAISAGRFHSCALTAAGQAWCWGYNPFGELRGGSLPVPAPVPGELRFVAITAGYEHTCGVTRDGVAYCWGNNYWSAVGGDAPYSSTPLAVPGGLTFPLSGN